MRTLLITAVSLGLLEHAGAQVTERVSVATGGAQANFGADLPSPPGAVVSADGRCVAFTSPATNLVPGDSNGTWDVFVRDRLSATTERVSVDSNGLEGNGFSGGYGIAISPDGRYVAFDSQATNLIPGGTNGARNIFLRDRQTGTTKLVSIAIGGAQADGNCFHVAMTPDGRYVAFESVATNLVPGDTNGQDDLFIRDFSSGTTERVSVDSAGMQSDRGSYHLSVSANGRYVAFDSDATNLVPGDTNHRIDVFVRDRQSGLTTRVSVDSSGTQAVGDSDAPSISSDGRYVAFSSDAGNLVAGDTNGCYDVFVHDRRDGTTERVSVATGGMQGNGLSYLAFMSADARFVAFSSGSTNFVSGAGVGQAYLRDRKNGTTEVVSVATNGSFANNLGDSVCVTAGGRYVVFRSAATNLVAGDTNANGDVFIHDRFATGFTNMCDPGAGGVIACPCSNPPGGSGQGCDNSAATGGAILSASGIAYLSIDRLVFATSGEPPTAFSIVMQGNALVAHGVVYGQGVRCAGGATKRLFVKSAVAGGILAPDFTAGDPTVSARSAANGDVIQPGQSRWYLVYYRDPVVLGGCSATSTFNATQTGQVTWWP
ncbi:MAG TPA: calcium-binding protein [Planctomycetota bacterium]|jgi:Tol biopolymer transport system component|nr:calcium-binding protein [Planctomycetota bacterium]